MRFVYTRRGGPLLDWSGVTPPYQSRAGETRSLGDFYPTTRSSNALRRYGGPGGPRGAAIGYEHNRRLGYWGSDIGSGSGTGYRPAPGMGDLSIPLPGAPEIVEGYEDPAPGAAIVHLGEDCTFDLAHRRSHGMAGAYPWDEKYPGQTSLSGYMPEGAARRYGQQMLGAEPAPAPKKQFDMSIVRKASALASAYHGVKRNNGSVFWGLLWGIAGYAAPFYGLLMPAIGVAQGFGQQKVRSNPARSSHRRRMKAAKQIVLKAKRRKQKRRPKRVWLPGAKVWARIGKPPRRAKRKR